jgi:membrane-associated PAP2 superfamily phosphatase
LPPDGWSRRFYLRQALFLASSAVVLACVFHFTRLDVQLATPYYDATNHTFPWRYAWTSKYLVHRYLKYGLLLAGVLVWAVALWLHWRPQPSGLLRAHRRRWWLVAWSVVAVPVVIGVLRHSSAMHCPWDVADFGGYAPYFDLFSPVPAHIRPGRCFPGAFVASGGWLLAFGLLWYPEHKLRSAAVGGTALLIAFAMGWVQQMRGAHFLSHTLWSLWISWAVVLLLHRVCGAWRE